MKNLFPIICICFSILLCINCKGTDDIQDTTDPETEVDVDPIPNKTSTYITDAKSIIDSNCVECHSNPPTQSAPMSLETYTEVVNAVNDRNLFGRIATTNQFNVMPESGRLPDATILSIEDWIADGLVQQ